WFAQHTNPRRVQGSAGDALVGADIFVGLSGPGVVSLKDIKAMNKDAIVFAMANPVPEILPEEAGPFVRGMAARHRVREANPVPGDPAGGGGALREGHGPRPLRLSEPDQQLVRLSGILPRH